MLRQTQECGNSGGPDKPSFTGSKEELPIPVTSTDNQGAHQRQLFSSSSIPLNEIVGTKAVYTATSTPEIREPVVNVAAPMESVTCPTLNIHTPSIKIQIHRAPTSMGSSQNPPRTCHSQVSMMSNALTPSLSKIHTGTVAAKLGRRRASSNASSFLGHPSMSSLSTTHHPGTSRRKSWDQRVAGPIRRASQAIVNLANASGVLSPSRDSVSMSSIFGSGSGLYGECSRRDSRIRSPEIILMYSSFQRLPMKDFGAEVRASMDVDQFLQQAVLLLDITETSLEGIVDRMLRKVCTKLFLYDTIALHTNKNTHTHAHHTFIYSTDTLIKLIWLPLWSTTRPYSH